MKKFFKYFGLSALFILLVGLVFYLIYNEPLPKGTKGKEAEALAVKMANALNYDAFKDTEVLEWSFRNTHFYKWFKQQNSVEVSWDANKVILHTQKPTKSEAFVNNKKVNNSKLIETATRYFNNDSFWLVAPYKIFDPGTERKLVNYNNKKALLVTYTSGGSTPGDSYLWILDDNYLPTAFKMWTSIIPIGGVGATWNNLQKTPAGILLPKKHNLSLFNLELAMGKPKAYNPNADLFAKNILKAIHHEAYKKTKFIEWSFRGKRFFKWDKEKHWVDVSWDTIRVHLNPRDTEKSIVYFNDKQQKVAQTKIIQRAWNIFNNDSFWLVAPHKLFDKGTIRSIKNRNGEKVLHIKYTTGGSTPGDSYEWFVDSTYLPVKYKMYIPSMKMNGVSATWQDWIVTESGTKLPTKHVFDTGRELSMGKVKAYN